MNIRYPKITGKTPDEKIVQMESWLRQLVDQLNWALTQLEQSNTTNESQRRKDNGYYGIDQ